MKRILIALTFVICSAAFCAIVLADPAVNGLGSMTVGKTIQTPQATIAPLPAPTWVDAVVLTTNTPASYIVATPGQYVLFSSTAAFYVNYQGTAAVPGSGVTNGSASELNPTLRSIAGGTAISLIAPAGCVVTIGVFK